MLRRSHGRRGIPGHDRGQCDIISTTSPSMEHATDDSKAVPDEDARLCPRTADGVPIHYVRRLKP